MTQSERGLGQRWFEQVWNLGWREVIAEILSPNAILHDGASETIGPNGFYPFFDRMGAAFSTLRVDVVETFAEGDRICVRWSCTARHTGDGLGMAATGANIGVTGITIMRVAEEKIVEAWQNWDMLAMMEQIQGFARSATYLGAPSVSTAVRS